MALKEGWALWLHMDSRLNPPLGSASFTFALSSKKKPFYSWVARFFNLLNHILHSPACNSHLDHSYWFISNIPENALSRIISNLLIIYLQLTSPSCFLVCPTVHLASQFYCLFMPLHCTTWWLGLDHAFVALQYLLVKKTCYYLLGKTGLYVL